MNGIGIVGTLERMPQFFYLLGKILSPEGQVLCDSSDISYVFEDEEPLEEGGTSGIDNYTDDSEDMDYYGELSFRMRYKDTIGEPFPWIYVDADTLRRKAEENGYQVDVVAEGEHYDYLARITRKKWWLLSQWLDPKKRGYEKRIGGFDGVGHHADQYPGFDPFSVWYAISWRNITSNFTFASL